MSGKRPRQSDPVLWPDEAAGPWAIRLKWGLVGGRRECVGFGITWVGEAPPEVLTARLLREVPLGEIISAKRADYHEALLTVNEFAELLRDRHGEPLPVETHMALTDRLVTEMRSVRRGAPGRKPMYGREHYQQVADIYRDAHTKGQPPTKTVAAFFNLSSSAAGKHVAKARSMGLLPPTSRGKAKAGE